MTISHEEYGAKAANLAIISPLVSELDASSNFGMVGIPDFESVSSSVYERWLNHDLTGAELFDLYKQARVLTAKGNGLMVRSSAVLGEDGDTAMGAGVYDSVHLAPGFGSVAFFEAMKTVYESTKGPKAAAYLEQLGINPGDERMGLVMQTYPKLLRSHYTLDTAMVGAPELMLARNGLLPFEPRETQPDRLGSVVLDKLRLSEPYRYLEDVFHAVPDYRKFDRFAMSDSAALGRIALEIEKYVGSSVQVEALDASLDDEAAALVEERYSASRRSGLASRQHSHPNSRLWIVQSRPLSYGPEASERFDGFPDDDDMRLAYVGRGLSVLNGVKVRASQQYMSECLSPVNVRIISSLPDDEKRMFVFDGSYAKGWSVDILTKDILQLPPAVRKKIVILVEGSSRAEDEDNFGGSGGHIETMCLELGVACIFNGEVAGRRMPTEASLHSGDRFTVYSNGYEARVYSTPVRR